MSLINYYFKLAEGLCNANTKLEKVCGVVIVKKQHIVSMGCTHCMEKNNDIEQDIYYSNRFKMQNSRELGRCIHAEIMAINAVQSKCLVKASLYLVGKNMKENKLISDVEPCMSCMHAIIGTGIKKIICKVSENEYRTIYL